MRLCKNCGELMRYNETNRTWECPNCEKEISAVTIHGERGVRNDYGELVETW